MDGWENFQELRAEMLGNHFGFVMQEFCGQPEGYPSYAPAAHVSWWIDSGTKFQEKWNELLTLARTFSNFRGYFEGEWVATDQFVPESNGVFHPPPWKFVSRRLHGGNGEQFRQSELHLVYDREKSDARITKALLEAGMFGAYMEQAGIIYTIMTVQGYLDQIARAKELLLDYLSTTGGIVDATLKEERIVRHQLFGVTPQELAPIIDRIEEGSRSQNLDPVSSTG